MKKLIGFLTIVTLLTLAPRPLMAQCPMCKAAVTTGSNYGAKESKLVAGLNTGILYLFVLPYGSLMLIGVVFLVARKKHRQQHPQELSNTHVDDVLGNHQVGPRAAEE
ncbi:MAG: hypothetical protein U0176_07185 [Bacteroidia bacterium]